MQAQEQELELDRKTVVAANRGDIRFIDKLYRIGIPKRYFTDTLVDYPSLFEITWDADHVIHLRPLPADLQRCGICGRPKDKTIGLYEKRVCPTCIGILAEKMQEVSHV